MFLHWDKQSSYCGFQGDKKEKENMYKVFEQESFLEFLI